MIRTKFPKCQCGCGQFVNALGNKFLKGHNLRLPLSKQTEIMRRKRIGTTMKKLLSQPAVREKMFKKAWKGRPHSEETKKKLSLLRTGEGNGMYEKTVTKETINKILKSRKGYRHSEETKRKIGQANKKNKPSEKQREQISKTLKEYYKEHPGTFKGRTHTEKTKIKIKQAKKGQGRGCEGSNWQGGIACLPYAPGWTSYFIEKIRASDNHNCQNPTCKDPHPLLDVHHIDYDKQNHDPQNLITLCKRCHGKTQKNREYWKKYYQKIARMLDSKRKVLDSVLDGKETEQESLLSTLTNEYKEKEK